MSDLKDIIKNINNYVDERDWQQYQKPKDLAVSIAIEAGEVLELFQWKTDEEVQEYIKNNQEELADELADVFHYLLKLASDAGIDMKEASKRKIEKVKKKYPVEKVKGKNHKYTAYT